MSIVRRRWAEEARFIRTDEEEGGLICVGAGASCWWITDSLRLLLVLFAAVEEARKLVRRASRRLMILELERSGSWLEIRDGRVSSAGWTGVSGEVYWPPLLPGLDSDFSSDSAMQSSVKLRHSASAFLRSCRSMAKELSWVDDCVSEEMEPLVIAASVRASEADFSTALYNLGAMRDCDFARAE